MSLVKCGKCGTPFDANELVSGSDYNRCRECAPKNFYQPDGTCKLCGRELPKENKGVIFCDRHSILETHERSPDMESWL